MKHLISCLLVGLIVVGLSGCMVAPIVPPIGIGFTEFTAPLDPDFNQTAMPTDHKTGTSESISILGLIALGDASTEEAARDGDITVIDHADYEYFNVLGVFQRYNTIVYGH